MDILKAYQVYVSTFKLTGESQVIGNLVGGFSEKYYTDQKKDVMIKLKFEYLLNLIGSTNISEQ